MLLEYAAIAGFILVTVLVGAIAIILGILFGPRKKSETKSMPYESGMNPDRTRHTPAAGAVLSYCCPVHPVRH